MALRFGRRKCFGIRLQVYMIYLKRFITKKVYIESGKSVARLIRKIPYKDNSFDAVVAGNVIHYLDKPQKAMKELMRVCKKDGKVIIPTYINKSEKNSSIIVKLLECLGSDCKRQFDARSYKKFFSNMGIQNVEYKIVQGRMPCAIAIITP